MEPKIELENGQTFNRQRGGSNEKKDKDKRIKKEVKMNLESVVGGVGDVVSIEGADVGIHIAGRQQGVVTRRVPTGAQLAIVVMACTEGNRLLQPSV